MIDSLIKSQFQTKMSKVIYSVYSHHSFNQQTKCKFAPTVKADSRRYELGGIDWKEPKTTVDSDHKDVQRVEVNEGTIKPFSFFIMLIWYLIIRPKIF